MDDSKFYDCDGDVCIGYGSLRAVFDSETAGHSRLVPAEQRGSQQGGGFQINITSRTVIKCRLYPLAAVSSPKNVLFLFARP
jgi:hypothetical protein